MSTECTCGPCPIHDHREKRPVRLAKDHEPPNEAETAELKRLRDLKSPDFVKYMGDLYTGNTLSRGPNRTASIRQIADALGVTYAAVYQRLDGAHYIKKTK